MQNMCHVAKHLEDLAPDVLPIGSIQVLLGDNDSARPVDDWISEGRIWKKGDFHDRGEPFSKYPRCVDFMI